MADTATAVTVGLLIRLEAAPGREADVQNLLEGGLSAVQEEPKTTAWFGIRLGDSTFGIFDVFPDEDGRQAHLSGRVAQALADNPDFFAEQPDIQQIDVIASKLPR